VSVCVCHMPVLYRNGCTDRYRFLPTYPTLWFNTFKETGYLKNKVTHFLLDLENVTKARSCTVDSRRFVVDSTWRRWTCLSHSVASCVCSAMGDWDVTHCVARVRLRASADTCSSVALGASYSSPIWATSGQQQQRGGGPEW